MRLEEFNKIAAEQLTTIIGVDNTVATTTTKADIQINPICPHCGESYYMQNYGMTTSVYYPPIYKDGVNINPNRNKTTFNCTCMNCGKEFSFTE